MKEKIITNLIFLILVNFVCDSGSSQQSEPKIVHVIHSQRRKWHIKDRVGKVQGVDCCPLMPYLNMFEQLAACDWLKLSLSCLLQK